jgi:hypothetical protein
MLAKVAAMGGDPTNAAVKKIVGYFKGTEAPPGGKNQIIDLEINTHTVPQCAMKVRRTKELGAYTPYTDASPCNCYFEAKANGVVPTGCKTCMNDGDCGDAGTMICSYGYCEAK